MDKPEAHRVVEVSKEEVVEEDLLLMVVQVVEVDHPQEDQVDWVVEVCHDLRIQMQLHQVSISQVPGYSMHLMEII